ncbi:MAG: hypothetical protein NUK65_09690 [Firmicutes bacterium]|nr:hypothetical protein [Bacillota bacterium]
MKKKVRKLIAPVIITCLVVTYFSFFLVMTVLQYMELWIKLLAMLFPLGFIGVSVFVLLERIKEVRSGEEDDLSKY